jgi:DNA polymerase-1
MLVGEAPGWEEDRTGRNFAGDAGVLLNRVLGWVSIRREDVPVANILRCRPPSNRDPTDEEIDACRPHLVDDIRRLNPKVVVLMGNFAAHSVLRVGRSGITKVRGSVRTSDEFPGVYFIPTLHPASALRRWQDELPLRRDLSLALRICREGYHQIETKYSVCRTPEEVEWVLRRLSDSTIDFCEVDSETTGFDCLSDKVVCVSFSNREGTGWAVPIVGYQGREVWSPDDKVRVVGALKRFLEGDTPKAMQNGQQFDRLMFRGSFGIEMEGLVVDSMLLHHLVDENLPHGLDFLSGWYTDVSGEYKDVPEMRKKGGASNVPDDKLWEYSSKDADVGYRVSRAVLRDAVTEDVLKVHNRITLPYARVMADAEWYGIRINMDTLNEYHELYMARYSDQVKKVYEAAGCEFDIRSPQQRVDVLFNKLKLPIVRRNPPCVSNPKGNPTTDAAALTELKKVHPVAGELIKATQIAHDIGTYLRGMNGNEGILKHVRSDGRVHPRWKLHGAVTGRLSSEDPAIQNIKRDTDDPEQATFRRIFAATEEWVFLSFDYQQAELYVEAKVAPDDTLLDMLLHPPEVQLPDGKVVKIDVHMRVAGQKYGIPPELVTKEQRYFAKFVVFGLNYGETAYGLAEDLGCSEGEAQKYIDSYFSLFKGVAAHFAKTRAIVDSGGIIVSPFGRKRRLYAAPMLKKALEERRHSKEVLGDFRRALNEMYRMAVNVTIQSPANDALGLGAIRIAERLRKYKLKGRLLISHHDAWHGECPEDELVDTAEIVKEELEKPIPELGGQVIPTEATIGRCWGDDSIKVKGIT